MLSHGKVDPCFTEVARFEIDKIRVYASQKCKVHFCSSKVTFSSDVEAARKARRLGGARDQRRPFAH